MPAVQVAAGGAGPPEALNSRPVPRVAAGADQVVDRRFSGSARPGERGGVGVDELLHADSGGLPRRARS